MLFRSARLAARPPWSAPTRTERREEEEGACPRAPSVACSRLALAVLHLPRPPSPSCTSLAVLPSPSCTSLAVLPSPSCPCRRAWWRGCSSRGPRRSGAGWPRRAPPRVHHRRARGQDGLVELRGGGSDAPAVPELDVDHALPRRAR